MTETARRVREALGSVADRSFGSDELAALAGPGWDQYHLGSGGANVMRPLGITAGERVLVLGAGSGVLVRYAADAGARVVGVESDPEWLGAAEDRVADCREVQLDDALPDPDAEPFDLVLIAATPETSPVPVIGELLAAAVSRLADGGVVAAAVPNIVSVARLSGFDPAELAGVASGITPAGLADAFEAAGLSVDATLLCYPDIFTSSAILAETTFDGGDAVAFVDQLVGAPVSGLTGSPFVLADDRAVLRALVAAGVGAATAPGLLVAGALGEDDVEQRLGADSLAWRFTGGRKRPLQQQLVVRGGPGGLVASRRLVHEAVGEEPEGWLVHTIAPEQPYLLGENLEQRALEAMADGEIEALRELLERWLAELEAMATDRPDVPPHPFLGQATRSVLPPDHLDAGLDNFTESSAGLVFVDREWRAAGGVDFDLAVSRALWKLAVSTIRNGSGHPWRREATVEEVWGELVALTPYDMGRLELERWWFAEGDLMEIVTGADPTATVGALRDQAARSRVDRPRYPAGVEAAAALHDLDRQVERLTDQLADAHAQMADKDVELAAMSERLEELRGMLPVRLGRQVKRLLGR